MDIDKFIDVLNDLDAKYHFSDEEVEKINECLYGNVDEDMKGEEYAEEVEYTDED